MIANVIIIRPATCTPIAAYIFNAFADAGPKVVR